MKILHTYCLNYNIGDYALGIGVKKILRDNLQVELIGETNIQGREFDQYYINEVVNKKYDLLVIGGGGIIHGAHWPNGWFWLIDKNLIKTIKVPFIVYGVGFNYWDSEGGIPERGKLHLKETVNYASYFSVRNDGSAKRIFDQTGIKAPSVPDPGFHVNSKLEYKRKINEPYVILQIANDKPLRRFGSIDKQKKFVKQMRDVVKYLTKKYTVIMTPHVFDDISISYEIISNIEKTKVWDFGYYAFDNSKEALGYYKYADFVLAMRGHGQIVPIAFNTPVISLENHPKHRGLMEELDLLDYNVKIRDTNLASSLISRIDALEFNRKSLQKQYMRINEKLKRNTKRAFVDIRKAII